MYQPLFEILARTRRRVRLQRAMDGATTFGIVGALCTTGAIYLAKAGIISLRQLWAGLAAAVGVTLLGAAIGMARRVRLLHLAKRVDTSHGLHDRIGTAVEFSQLADPTGFHLAQLQDALRHVSQVAPARAVPLRWPRDLKLLGLTLLCLLFILMLRFPATHNMVPPRPPLARLSIAPEDLEPHRAMALELQKAALEQDQQQISELAQELNKLFKQIQNKELTRKELFAKLAELEKKYLDGMDGNFEDLLKKLKKMGGELKKEKLTKEAGKALEKANLSKAKQELDQLSKKLDKLKQDQKRRLARTLDRAARQKMDKDKLQRKLDQLKRQIRRLKRQLNQQKKNNQQARRRLERKKRQLQRLNRQQQRQAQQRRQLQRLNKQMQQAAASLRNQLSPQAKKALQQAAQQMGRFANQLNKLNMQGKAQGQIVDLKEMLRRLGKGGKGKKGKLKDFLARAKGLKPGQKGNKGKGKQGMMLDPNGQGGALIMPLPGPPQAGADNPNGPPGDGIGNSSDPNLQGQTTQLKTRRRNVMVRGQQSQGPTKSEVILGASEKGFATQHYRRVYREYTEIIEEVLKREEVPLGYKYYVKRYFQLIKPR